MVRGPGDPIEIQHFGAWHKRCPGFVQLQDWSLSMSTGRGWFGDRRWVSRLYAGLLSLLLALSPGQPTESSERADRESRGVIERAEQRTGAASRDGSREGPAEARRQAARSQSTADAPDESEASTLRQERAAAGAARGRHPRLSPALNERVRRAPREREMVDVIVRFSGKAGASDRTLASQLGGTDRRGYKKFPFRAVRVPARPLQALAARP